MEVKIDKESKEFTVTAKTDFYRFLDENFTEICIAIERKGKILKELANMVDKDANAMDKYQKIMWSIQNPMKVLTELQKQLGLSNEATLFLAQVPFDLESFNIDKNIKKLLDYYQKNTAPICDLNSDILDLLNK